MENLRIVDYLSQEHASTITLRNKVLREPLGLIFSEQDLEDEAQAIHLAYFTNQNAINFLAGACFLTPHKEDTLKLRQMAVDASCQGKGIGRKLIAFAEQVALERGYSYLYLHARKEALNFYIKQNYKQVSDEFFEVGIPHYEMIKEIVK